MAHSLPWGQAERIEVAVPPAWIVVKDHQAVPRPGLQDFAQAVAKAISAPTAGPSLPELARAAKKAVLVIDDVGRPTPGRLIAPAVLEALLAAGLTPDRIDVVFAVGTHRPMTEPEMRRKAGDEIVDRLRCQNHDRRQKDRLRRLGVTSFGTTVLFNQTVADADLRVLIGTIEPHPQAGFGGGLKNLLPGVAGADAIGHNHLLMPSPDRYNMIGTPPAENPMRQDIEEAASMLPGKNFLLNTVLGPNLAPVALVSGDAIAAHRQGVDIARALYGVQLPGPLDAVIVSSFPMDVDLRQGVKGVANFSGAVRKGGVIVCFLKCERGMEDVRPPRWVPPLAPIKAALKLIGAGGIHRLTKLLPAKVPVEARFIINFGLQVFKDRHPLIFSPRLCRDTGGAFKTLLFDDQDRMFERAERLLKSRSPEVAIVAEGGVSFPVVGP